MPPFPFAYCAVIEQSHEAHFIRPRKAKLCFLSGRTFPRFAITSWHISKSFFEINGSCVPSNISPRSWLLADGWRKCRRCGTRRRPRSVWDVCRLPDRTKRQLLDYFILGVSVYRLRWKRLGNRKTIERFFQIVRAILAIHEDCREPFDGSVELDESTFGGRRKGKRGWGAEGKIIVLGILKRNGRVKVFPVPRRRKRWSFRSSENTRNPARTISPFFTKAEDPFLPREVTFNLGALVEERLTEVSPRLFGFAITDHLGRERSFSLMDGAPHRDTNLGGSPLLFDQRHELPPVIRLVREQCADVPGRGCTSYQMLATDDVGSGSGRGCLYQRQSRFEINDLMHFEAVSLPGIRCIRSRAHRVPSTFRRTRSRERDGVTVRERQSLKSAAGRCGGNQSSRIRRFLNFTNVEWSMPDMLSKSR